MTNLTIFYRDDDEDDLSIFADAVESLPELRNSEKKDIPVIIFSTSNEPGIIENAVC